MEFGTKMKDSPSPTTSSFSSSSMQADAGPKWERVLFRKLFLPDNYCDDKQFLNQLRKNVTVVHYSLPEAVRGACMVMGHVNLIVLYLCTFEYVQMKQLAGRQLALIVTALVLFCASLYLILDAKSLTYNRIVDHGRTMVTILLFGYGFTPIIRTLTTSISTDTIYAISFGLFFLSLIFHDYGLEAPIVSSTFSANLSLAASVFLISRVDTDQLAFCLLTFSLCAFCLWPRLRNLIFFESRRRRDIPPILLLVLGPLSITLISTISTPLSIIHAVLHLFLVVGCPALLVGMQHFKSTIHGPWDEASLKASLS